MDPRLLSVYNQELQHLREMGAEFARQFPKIAARLSMDGVDVTDPYVERLLEGAAFLAARVHLRLDAEFPRFTQRLLDVIYPGYLSPTPAMVIARFEPTLTESNLARGVTIPRGTALRAQQGKDDLTACEFRTAQDVELWPIELVGARYCSLAPDLPIAQLPARSRVRGGIRLHLRSTAGLKFNEISLDRLRIFLSGSDEMAYKLHELCHGACTAVIAGPAPAQRTSPWHHVLAPSAVQAVGFEDDQSLLPASLRGFQGHRLLQEYFAFPQRFLFLDLAGLAPTLQRLNGGDLEIAILFEREAGELESRIDVTNFSLYCAPAINLFPRRADRIHVSPGVNEFHVVPDRTRPMDFEVSEIRSLSGYGAGSDSLQQFYPLYAAFHDDHPDHQAYFTVRREPRLLPSSRQRTGFRSSYVGTEVFVAIVDPKEAPYRADLRQLAVTTLCTNRDLPLQMPVGIGKTDFTLEIAAPVQSVRCIKGPSKPYAPMVSGALGWRAISLLSLNYLSLLDANASEGAAALRELLQLFAANVESSVPRHIEGVRTCAVKPVNRRLPFGGPIAFGRGIEIVLGVDELAFEGASAFLFGAVMQRFFTRHVSLNSFVETCLRSASRGEIMRWRPQCGSRPIL
jgi:type VI secretion system protein ImpG